jgi:uncharacterized peroxidase-related enzyme
MARIQPIDPQSATGESRELLDSIAKKRGKAINIQRVIAHSPAALQAYLGINGALAQGDLAPQLRERIALVVAQENGCDYCLAAHTFLGGKVGLSVEEIDDARRGKAGDPKERAIVGFAQTMVRDRANVSDADMQRLRDVGLSEGEIVETVANVVLNIFTNYINHVADTPVDFPAAAALEVFTALPTDAAPAGSG